ncbi:Flp pilus assembly protein CpaB, partial [Phenylobacterium sp.]|uniref:Flp pilus assembly protein CpaB n=1 Tax=Phenylobacterium sp. TaxID=1871053 RepID=UPI00286B44CC
MRVVTIASLGASAALGLGALLVAKVMLPSQSNVAQAAPPSPMANAVSVVVASRDIKYGDRLDAARLTVVRMPRDAAPAGAFATVDQVLAQDHGGAPVALTPLSAREIVLPAKLSGPGARPSIAAEITAGMRAYTIRVSDVSGVGGHALPGDRVDVVLMRDLSTDDTKKILQSEVVIQNARVLGVDLNADPTSNKPATPSTATLEVSVKDTQKLAVAADLG